MMKAIMETSPDLFDFARRCESAHSLLDLEALWEARMHALGFKFAVLGAHIDPLRPSSTNYMFHTYPSEWIKRFSAQNYQAIDPVYRGADNGLSGFEWTDPDFLGRLTWRQKRILHEAREFGLCFGRTHALAPVLNLKASGSFVTDEPEMDPAASAAGMIANVIVHNRASQLCAGASLGYPALSSRERQCLQLCARGLTDADVGKTLGISSATVRRHIEAARTRFGVSTRIQAVLRAIRSGQIEPWN